MVTYEEFWDGYHRKLRLIKNGTYKMEGVRYMEEAKNVVTEDNMDLESLVQGVDEDLENRFSYHAPNASQLPRYNYIREAVKQLAYTIKKLTPASREQSVALTHLDQVMFNANAAIARNEK